MEAFTIKEIRRLLNQKGFDPSTADLKLIHARWKTMSVRIKELNDFDFGAEEIAPVFNPSGLGQDGVDRG